MLAESDRPVNDPAGGTMDIRRRTDNPARDLRDDRKRAPAFLDAIRLVVQGLSPEDRVLLRRRRLSLHCPTRSVRLSR